MIFLFKLLLNFYWLTLVHLCQPLASISTPKSSAIKKEIDLKIHCKLDKFVSVSSFVCDDITVHLLPFRLLNSKPKYLVMGDGWAEAHAKCDRSLEGVSILPQSHYFHFVPIFFFAQNTL